MGLNMNVLVTGGAGYIGSHAAKRLAESGHQVIVVDNLDRGHRAAVEKHIPLEELDLRDTKSVLEVLTKHKIECVMHFAALSYVGESVQKPLRYYDNNFSGSMSLLCAMDVAKVQRMVFSSTCATYGEPQKLPITEDTPQIPISPYGWSKLMVERMLRDYATTNSDFCFGAPRYFNVAGCAPDGSLGEDHDPETHLIPLMLKAALGQIPKLTIFGDDYPTPDGTCIRDYIHVEDLVNAHVILMETLQPGDQRFYNLGVGYGHSVKELVDAAKHVTGVEFEVEIGPRRQGDPPELFANAEKIQHELGWQARFANIDQLVETAWMWFKENPDGYGD